MKALRRTSALVAALLGLLLAGSAYAAVGALTQKAGTAGCVSDNGSSGACVDGVALAGASGVAISPDGSSVYAAANQSDSVGVFDRTPSTGSLVQKAGTAGCVSETGAGPCADGKALDAATSVAISPDGKNAYVASSLSDAIVVFDRDTSTGSLTQKAGTAGCVSETGSGGDCADGVALDATTEVTVSPDGASVYAASFTSDAVVVFDRNTSTGALTQKAGTSGCVSETGSGGLCADGVALDGAIGVTVSPDGTSAYVASAQTHAVAVFDRNISTGALTQKAGTSGCVAEAGGVCADGKALLGAAAVAVAPGGSSVYVASAISNAIAVFDRNTATGVLTQKAGTAGCVSEDGTGGTCADGVALQRPTGIAVSADGLSIYSVTTISDAVPVFDRDPATGALAQRSGTAGCVSDTGTSGACVDGTALDGTSKVVLSADGRNAYAGAVDSGAVSIFDRDGFPQTSIDLAPTGTIDDATPSFAFSSSDPGSTFQCRLDGDAFAACSGPGATHTTAALSEGPHTFEVRATDPAANTDPTPASATFTIDLADQPPAADLVPPETTITKQPKAKVRARKAKAKVEVSFTSEPGATFECRLDNGAFAPCASPFAVKAKAKGGKGKGHTIEVRATDAAGNVETTPATVRFVLKRAKR